MKIKQIVGKLAEDGVTISGISGDKAKLSNGQEIDAKTLAPDTEHPGQYKAPEMDPTALKPGAVVNMGDEQQTSEEVDEATGWNSMNPEAADRMMSAYNDLAPHIEKYQDEAGAGKLFKELTDIAHHFNVVPQFKSLIMSAKHGAHQDYDTNPGDFKNWFWYVGDMLKHVAKGDSEEGGIEVGETHHDLISQGDHDVGGDATDSFIRQIKDKGFERANRNSPAQGSRSSLPESDELMKWLTIAGIK